MDFLNFFGLKEDPFKLTPDPAFFYPSVSHNEGLLLMDYAIDQKEGFLLIVGDPGTGKTTLLKVFLEKWRSRAEIAIVLTPRLSPEEFLVAVAEDFNIDIMGKNKNEIIRSLRDFMMNASSAGRRVIVIVDEAQNLPSETLEELRLLSNLETDKDKLIQIILLGQPELEAKLKSERLRQLNQRITTRVFLRHFNIEETRDYVNFRIIKAGKKNLNIHGKVNRMLYKRTGGVPRIINMLVSRALMAAYLEESNTILPRHVNHAIASLNHSDINVKKGIPVIPLAAGAVILLIVASGLFLYQYMSMTFEATTKQSSTDKTVEMQKEDTGASTSASVIAVKSDRDTGHNEYPEARSVSRITSEEVPLDKMRLISVTADIAFVRVGPSIDAGKAGWTIKGSQLLVLNEAQDDRNVTWYQISYQGERRWISGEVVELYSLDGHAIN